MKILDELHGLNMIPRKGFSRAWEVTPHITMVVHDAQYRFVLHYRGSAGFAKLLEFKQPHLALAVALTLREGLEAMQRELPAPSRAPQIPEYDGTLGSILGDRDMNAMAHHSLIFETYSQSVAIGILNLLYAEYDFLWAPQQNHSQSFSLVDTAGFKEVIR